MSDPPDVDLYERHRKRYIRKLLIAATAIIVLWSGVRLPFVLVRRAEVAAAYRRWLGAVEKGDWPTAYACMTRDYQAGHTLKQFTESFGLLAQRPDPHWDIDVGLTATQADVYAGDARGFWWGGAVFRLERINGDWFLTGEYRWELD